MPRNSHGKKEKCYKGLLPYKYAPLFGTLESRLTRVIHLSETERSVYFTMAVAVRQQMIIMH